MLCMVGVFCIANGAAGQMALEDKGDVRQRVCTVKALDDKASSPFSKQITSQGAVKVVALRKVVFNP